MGKQLPKYLNPFFAAGQFVMSRLPFKIADSVLTFIMVKNGKILLKPWNMRRNIRDIFPDMEEPAVEALVQKMIANFAHHIAEILHVTSFRDGKHGLRVDYSTPTGTTFDGKGPAIYVGAHVGSWEFLPLIFTQNDQPMTVIYSQDATAIIDDLLLKQRLHMGATYVEKDKALKPCYQALERGETVALLVDQRVNTGLEVDFFNRPTTISRLPARLAANFDCPIIPFEVIRVERGHLRVVFQEPILPNGRKGKDAELELTQAIATAVEQSIKRLTESWFCNKLRWKNADTEKVALQAKIASEGCATSSRTAPAGE